ncbi:hypothetical protein HY230_09810 [Candidatus Acetothermia bacterium]|nr:hypothetical protein [Candidatus Acetothermia bacterium]
MLHNLGKILVVGLMAMAVFTVFNLEGGLTNVLQTRATETTLQGSTGVSNQSSDSDYFGLNDKQIIELNVFRSKLSDLWAAVNEQKKILDTEINPGVDEIYKKIYGPQYGTPQLHIKGTPQQAEVVDKLFRESPFFAKTRKLQEDLTRIEAETAKLTTAINNYQQGMMDENPGKVLGEGTRNAFNDLRRKISLIASLVADIYRDDPPCECIGP